MGIYLLNKIWFYPPLAFARVGPSKSPCDNFNWGPNDITPRGSGKTTISPSRTLYVKDDGNVYSMIPKSISFKDSAGWKPVCPFFELHGEWSEGGELFRGPITEEVLGKFGKSNKDLKWRISVANLKPFHFTLVKDDQIFASIELNGNDTIRHDLNGISPGNADNPLVPPDKNIQLGSVQLIKTNDQLPTVRIRFTPPSGLIYGPTNLLQRTDVYKLPKERLILNERAAWCNFIETEEDTRTVPQGEYAISSTPDNVIDSSNQTYWNSFGKGQYIQVKLTTIDNILTVSIGWYKGDKRSYRFLISSSENGETFSEVFRGMSSGKSVSTEKYVVKNTRAQYVRITVDGNTENDWATISKILVNENDKGASIDLESAISSSKDNGVSLGLVDDICDGTIQCSLDENTHAFARIVVGPPKYSPDRRPFVSLADNLTDRMRRYDVREPRYVEENPEITSLEIQDFMERVLETVELTNIDVQNNRVFRYDRNLAVSLGLSDTDANKLAKEKVLPIISDEEKLKGRPLPLTEMGRQNHRRFVSLEVLEDMFRERPDLIQNYIRKPNNNNLYYDRQMPFAMRGSDGQPHTITQRQYNLLVSWQKFLAKSKGEL
jgi:hypothetical protein